jgi:hypothetical protein
MHIHWVFSIKRNGNLATRQSNTGFTNENTSNLAFQEFNLHLQNSNKTIS